MKVYKVMSFKSIKGIKVIGSILACALSLSNLSPSYAFPFAHSLCHDSGSDRSLRNLVAYYGPVDNRKLISEGGKELGLSAQEIVHLREVSGVMICPGPNGKGFATSATLEGNGDRILTAAHAFSQNDVNSIQFDKCYFKNQAIPQKISLLALTPKKQPDAMFNAGWPQDSTADYAVAKLETPIHIRNPFPFDSSGRRLTPEDKIIVVSGAQKHFDNHNLSEPIVQQCSAPDTMAVSTTIYYTNCALFHQASGSIGYVRDANGVLTQKILANGIGTQKQSEDYDFSKKQFSDFMGLDRAFLLDAKSFGMQVSPKSK